MIAVTTNSLIEGHGEPKRTRRLYQGNKLLSAAYRYEFSSAIKLFTFIIDAMNQKSIITISWMKSNVAAS
jgi:hypothetical protein